MRRYDEAFDKVVAEVRAAEVPDGSPPAVWFLYNMGVVVKTPRAVIPTYDANGNVTEYVSNNGVVAAHYAYSAFGETIVSDGELASSFSHQFSTKPCCSVTGCCEYQMRKYRSNLGRWLSRDSIAESGTWANLYMSCGNHLELTIDYLGEDAPNIGGRIILPRPVEQKIEPPDKPKDCGQPCDCGEDKKAKGIRKCRFVTVLPTITGGFSNVKSHWHHHLFHKDNEDRNSKPECWNPSYCFAEEPTCPEDWQPYGHRSFLTDGNTKVTLTTPAWDFDRGILSGSCYEMQTRDWGAAPSVSMGRWCTKCESNAL